MWTPVYYVRLAPLPLSVDGVTLQDCIIYVVKIDKKDKPHENIQKKRSTILVPRPSLLFCILVKAERR